MLSLWECVSVRMYAHGFAFMQCGNITHARVCTHAVIHMWVYRNPQVACSSKFAYCMCTCICANAHTHTHTRGVFDMHSCTTRIFMCMSHVHATRVCSHQCVCMTYVCVHILTHLR
jgi:hypothetical protein